jgi:tetrapyrrole methylase family protein/MazG family protein
MTQEFEKLVDLVKHLRSENGCSWDRTQTISTLKEDVLSEADELREAIDKNDYENIKEEIGDLIWGLVLMSRVAEEEGRFNIRDVLNEVTDKIVRRHPHVFGNVKANTPEEAHKSFLEAKNNEKKGSSGPTQN